MRDLWEFPGGKVKTGESPAGALQRELAEELGIGELETAYFRQVEHDYPELQVRIDFFIVSGWRGTPAGIEGQQLRWIDVDQLDTALLLPADAPVVAELRNSLQLSRY
jgi:8-oxo-dGTP diphosphatase